MKVTKTQRGFEKILFSDQYNCQCSLQQSSSAEKARIWLGVENADPKVLASKARSFGIETNETTGWVPYPIPNEVLLTTRMHLDRKQVKELMKHLQNWLDTESFKNQSKQLDKKIQNLVEKNKEKIAKLE
jgi:uncharacterized protein (DUF342 family)